MKKELSKISVLQSGKVMGFVFFLLSVTFLFPVGLHILFFGADIPAEMIPWFFLAPFFYGIFSFVLFAFFSWLYNLVASLIGGIEFTFKE